MMLVSRQLEFSGQREGLRQLQVLGLYVATLGGLSFLLLDEEMFWAMLGVVEYDNLMVFLLNIL